jgi:hypothetical protein
MPLFMQQMVRTLTMAEASVVSPPQVLICDREGKWSHDVRRRLRDAGIRMVLIPERAPNANASAGESNSLIWKTHTQTQRMSWLLQSQTHQLTNSPIHLLYI